MKADLSIDLGRVPAYVGFLLEHGSDGLMVAGTTGEFVALEEDERSDLVAQFGDAAGRRVPVIAHVGHVNLAVAQRLAEKAARAGADALAGIVPYFHHASPSAVEQHLRNLARTCPELPFFVYNYPEATANRFPVDSFAALLAEPNVHGIKASVATWDELEPFLPFAADELVVCGNDSLMERFLAGGGRAVVSGNAAALPDLVKAALIGFTAPDGRARAKTVLAGIVPLTLAGSTDRLKELLGLRGMDVGPSRVSTYT